MEKKIEIAQRLEKWILGNFRTKTEFCKKVGMSTQSLNMYITGKTGIGTKLLARLREEGCDVEWLISGGGESPPTQILLKIKETDEKDYVMLEILNRVISLENEVNELKLEKLKTTGQTVL